MVAKGIGKIPPARTMAGMPAAAEKDFVRYDHKDSFNLSRWTPRQSFQYMNAKPWQKVSDFYLDLVLGAGYSSLCSLFSLQKNNFHDVRTTYNGYGETNIVRIPDGREGRWERTTYKIVLSYHGRSFDGWQKQPGLNTVQGLVEKSLGIFVDNKKAQQLRERSLPVEGCAVVAGRTDKGVTALQQVCSFYTWRKDVPCSAIEDTINAAAPGKLAALFVSKVSRVFHPNFAAKWRRYFYIYPMDDCTPNCNIKSSHSTSKEASYKESESDNNIDFMVKPKNFSIEKVNELLHQLEGCSLSYRVFARDTKASKSFGPSTDCFIFHARAAESKLPCTNQDTAEDLRVMCVELVANRFLRKMVRVLIATAIREAVAGVDSDALIKLMDATCRRATAPPAPPDGLCLVDVGYEEFNRQSCLII